MSIIEQFIGDVKEVPRHEAEALYQFIDAAKETLDIPNKITVFKGSSKLPNFFSLLEHPADKQAMGVLFSEGAQNLFDAHNLNTHVPEEFKAMVGHELSHIKDGKAYTMFARSNIPLLALSSAFAAGYYILDLAKHKKQEAGNEQLSMAAAIKEVVLKDNFGFTREKLTDETQIKARLYEDIMRYGGTIAAAALGLASGVGLSRQMILSAEYRADRTAATLVSPEIIKSSLEKLMNSFEAHLGATVSTSPNINEALSSLFKRMKNNFDAIISHESQIYQLEVTHAHPTNEQRFAALRELKDAKNTSFVNAASKNSKHNTRNSDESFVFLPYGSESKSFVEKVTDHHHDSLECNDHGISH